jgi:rhodanese-related sulfurtransferase
MKTLLLALLLPLLGLVAPTLRADEAKPAGAAVEKNVTPDEAEKLLKQKKDLVILDVRSADEFADGHIAGAKNLDFHGTDFAEKLKSLDKSKEYLVHCAAGGRSAQAVKKMKLENFQTIYHMNGGLHAWEAAGKPVEKGK